MSTPRTSPNGDLIPPRQGTPALLADADLFVIGFGNGCWTLAAGRGDKGGGW
ncbi:hypothetical protein BH09ACT8_BH09ACT8_04260 [soil metagenome]